MKRIGVVINPAAGNGRAVTIWEALRRSDSRLSAVPVVHAPDPCQARTALAALITKDIDTLIVLGGDGSLDLVANVLLEAGRGQTVAIAPLPVGTGSDFGRHLGLPRDPSTCLQRIFVAQPKPIDALEVRADDGRRCFALNVVSAGISGLVDAAVNARARPGKAAYLLATLGALARYRAVACRVWVDDVPWYEGDIFLVAVANGSSFGRGMRIAPEARCNDGAADVVLVGPVPRWQLLLRLPQIYRGSHLHSRQVRWRRGVSVRLEPRGKLPPFDVDGEVFDAGAARITLLPAALKVLA